MVKSFYVQGSMKEYLSPSSGGKKLPFIYSFIYLISVCLNKNNDLCLKSDLLWLF